MLTLAHEGKKKVKVYISESTTIDGNGTNQKRTSRMRLRGQVVAYLIEHTHYSPPGTQVQAASPHSSAVKRCRRCLSPSPLVCPYPRQLLLPKPELCWEGEGTKDPDGTDTEFEGAKAAMPMQAQKSERCHAEYTSGDRRPSHTMGPTPVWQSGKSKHRRWPRSTPRPATSEMRGSHSSFRRCPMAGPMSQCGKKVSEPF